MRQPETVKVANYLIERLSKATVTAELLHPDELVSGMISQIAASPELAGLLSGFIYSHQGAPLFQPWGPEPAALLWDVAERLLSVFIWPHLPLPVRARSRQVAGDRAGLAGAAKLQSCAKGSLWCAGQEIYLRWPSRYHLQEAEPTSFGQIEELCRMKRETAIGYITEVCRT